MAEVASKEGLAFVERLHRELNQERERLLRVREERSGRRPMFVPAPEEFTVAPAPADLQDRRVEITGPVDRKMMINALNSGARVFMADFEDANSPTWKNVVEGQQNVHDAVRGTIELETPEKQYRLNGETATLVIRNRGWHLVERHFEEPQGKLAERPFRKIAAAVEVALARRVGVVHHALGGAMGGDDAGLEGDAERGECFGGVAHG